MGSRLTALSKISSALDRGRYAAMGRRLAEVRVIDAQTGKLIESDRQGVVRGKGQIQFRRI